jgi:hypothetical protein
VASKAGINIICVHKGLLPADYEKAFAGVWEYATAWDIGKAAKDWPQMTFVIYHAALRAFLELPEQAWGEFEASGRIKWAREPELTRARAEGLARQFIFANSAIKQMIFGTNAARLYRLRLRAAENKPLPAYSEDRLAKLKSEYELAAKEPSNLRYGYVRAG